MNVLDNKFVFIVGAPRSGTTWLNHILKSHPNVAGLGKELTIFSSYVNPIRKAWHEENYNITSSRWEQGLPLLWTEQELDKFIVDFLENVYSKVFNSNSQATHILDKHPWYSFVINDIMKYLPNAKIIHIIRDCRDVVPSMISANKRIGFGASNVVDASKRWRKSLLFCKDAKSIYPNNVYEVKYETLKENPFAEISKILEFCEIESEEIIINKIIEDNSIKRKVVSRPDLEFEKIRDLGLPVWKAKLSKWELYQIELIAGDLLLELGYTENRDWWSNGMLDRVKILLWKIRLKFK